MAIVVDTGVGCGTIVPLPGGVRFQQTGQRRPQPLINQKVRPDIQAGLLQRWFYLTFCNARIFGKPAFDSF